MLLAYYYNTMFKCIPKIDKCYFKTLLNLILMSYYLLTYYNIYKEYYDI